MGQLFLILVLTIFTSASQCPPVPPPQPAPQPTPPAPVGCIADADCGAAGTGAMCLHSKCLIWELGRKGSPKVANWGAGQSYCQAKQTATEKWRLPTEKESKYLCRKDENYEDKKEFSDGCHYAKTVLGADFDDWSFWSSTCRDSTAQLSREGSSANPCSFTAWGVDFNDGDANYYSDNYVDVRVRCVRSQ